MGGGGGWELRVLKLMLPFKEENLKTLCSPKFESMFGSVKGNEMNNFHVNWRVFHRFQLIKY